MENRYSRPTNGGDETESTENSTRPQTGLKYFVFVIRFLIEVAVVSGLSVLAYYLKYVNKFPALIYFNAR